jgi:hypothetical protein
MTPHAMTKTEWVPPSLLECGYAEPQTIASETKYSG